MIEHINEHLSEQSQLSAKRAYQIAVGKRQSIIGTPHVFLALVEHPDEILLQIFDDMSLDIERLKNETLDLIDLQGKAPFWKGKKYQILVTPFVKQAIEDAILLSRQLEENKASSAHIFWGVINSCVENRRDQIQLKMSQILKNNNLEPEKVLRLLKELSSLHKKDKSA
ncbi:MAG: hypothetical protein JNM55_11510 [Anaerolineales bacterium]|nr:hypothetical protein [Anaerolineales bacterium]